MTEMNNTRELAANIIDIFEDFLASKTPPKKSSRSLILCSKTRT